MIIRTIAIAVMAVIVAGYMIFDGTRALSGAGYFAPGGQLGPWTNLLKEVRIDPQSRGVALTFVVYGALLLAALAYYLAGPFAGGIVLVVVAVLGLWYLPFGTLGVSVIIGLVIWDLATR